MARLSAGARRCARHWALPARHPPRVLNDHRPIAPARRTDSTVALTLIPEVWAWRWAPEMHEVADTLSDQHLPTDLALALANVLQRWADTATGQPTDPTTILRQLHAHPS